MKIIILLSVVLINVIALSQNISTKVPTTLNEIYNKDKHPIYNIDNENKIYDGSWTQGSNMPYPRYYGGSVMYTRNDTSWLYVIGGDTTGSGIATTSCLRYNVNTDNWEYIAPMPEALRTNTAVIAGDKIYTMGGFNAPYPAPAVKSFYVYDISTNTWSQLPDLPVPLFFAGAVSYEDSLIYILGGVENTASNPIDLWSNKVRLFNINEESFRDADEMLVETAAFAYAISNAKILVSGGLKSENELYSVTSLGTINETNRSNINWSLKLNYPLSVYAHYAAAFPDNKIYLGGGSTTTGFNPINKVYEYDMDNDTYSEENNLPITGMAYFSGISIRNSRFSPSFPSVVKIVVAGGITTGPVISNQTWIYEDSVEVTNVESVNNIIPKDYNLLQNYPNPFNPSTTINFSIPEETFVKLEIFNSIGQKISTLVSENLSAGNYNYLWDAKGFSSGIYFCKMTADEFTSIKKMVLLK